MLDITTTVRKSKIEGRGLFALEDFAPGQVVLAWDLSNTLSDEQYARLPDDQKRYVIRYNGGWVYFMGDERFVNHSCDPNTIPRNGADVAIRAIQVGDEITSDYRPVMPSGERMECRCGAANCAGYIVGTAA